MERSDGRRPDELRPITITPHAQRYPAGSALIELGHTRVLCAASFEERVPPFLRNSGNGWITAEYSMLPSSTNTRSARESVTGRIGGRTHEIQRLIGRSLRSVARLEGMGERTFTIDCDVLQADGGTRTAAITGAYVALAIAVARMMEEGKLAANPLTGAVAATSAGIIDGGTMLDLCYEEDSSADVDFNVVMTDAGKLIEVQGTAERDPFSRERMDEIVTLAEAGIRQLFQVQRETLAALGIGTA